MSALRLLAEDHDDLTVVSAAVQDAIFKVDGAIWHKAARRFSVQIQRFVWEKDSKNATGQRVPAVLSFESILAVRAQKVAQSRRDAFASILSIEFLAGEAPAGQIILNLADGGAIRLDVECIDVVLGDIGPVRDAVARPQH